MTENAIGYDVGDSLTEEQRKWYLMGAADMEAGRLVKNPLESRTTNRYLPPRTSALTAEEARAVLACVEWIPDDVTRSAIQKLSLIANGENDV